MAIAIAPLPVPRSRISHSALRGISRSAQFDEQFGLRARHQRGRVTSSSQRPELLAPGDVGHRFAGEPALHTLSKRCMRKLVEFVFGVCEQVAARHVDGAAQQELGVEPRRFAERLRAAPSRISAICSIGNGHSSFAFAYTR